MKGMPDLPDEGDVKKRQMILVGGLSVLVILVLIYLYATNPANQSADSFVPPPVEVDLTSPGETNDPIQNWVLQNENKLSAIEEQRRKEKEETDRQIQQLMDEIKRLREDNQALARDMRKPAVGSGTPVPTIPLPPRSSLPVNPPQVLPVPAGGKPRPAAPNAAPDDKNSPLVDKVLLNADNPPRIIKVKFNKKKGKKKRSHIRNTVPAGSFGQAVLLSGLDAPTGGMAERHPYPVLLELTDNASLPNRYRHRVKQCRVVGSGTGNISDERAYIRLERLTCILKNGEIISEVLTGTVIGEDGKNGLRGKLVSKQGQIIANAFLAGSLANIGNAVAQSYTTVATTATGTVSTLDPGKVLESGAAGGLGNSLDKIADWYFKRAEETYPVIEVSAGRIVDLFLTEDVALGVNLLSNYTPENPHE